MELIFWHNCENQQYKSKLTRWLCRLAHFDVLVQHLVGRNVKFTDYHYDNYVKTINSKKFWIWS